LESLERQRRCPREDGCVRERLVPRGPMVGGAPEPEGLPPQLMPESRVEVALWPDRERRGQASLLAMDGRRNAPAGPAVRGGRALEAVAVWRGSGVVVGEDHVQALAIRRIDRDRRGGVLLTGRGRQRHRGPEARAAVRGREEPQLRGDVELALAG